MAFSEKDQVRHDIFTLIKKFNPDLAVVDYMEITGSPPRTVAYWMSGDRAPCDFSLYLIKYALGRACMNIPRELNRHISTKYNRARKWSSNNKSSNSKPVFVGDYAESWKDWDGKAKEYFYNGKLLTIRKISEERNISSDICRARIKKAGLDVGSDVTSIINVKKNARSSRKNSSLKS